MQNDGGKLAEFLLSFILVLARVGGVVAFVPVPGWRRATEVVRIALALSLTLVLYPVWPKVPYTNPALGEALGWVLVEAFFGVFLGMGVNLLTESFVLAAQVIGLQAGYSYASTIDPSTEADSGVLQVLAQLTASMLFFSFRLDTEVIRALALSFQKYPPGAWPGHWWQLEAILQLSADMFRSAIRLALPVVALLVMLDVSLALLGRIQAQLQLLTLTFPAKMLAALVMLAAVAGSFPYVFKEQADRMVALWLR